MEIAIYFLVCYIVGYLVLRYTSVLCDYSNAYRDKTLLFVVSPAVLPIVLYLLTILSMISFGGFLKCKIFKSKTIINVIGVVDNKLRAILKRMENLLDKFGKKLFPEKIKP